jgi:Fructose-bisphosphate aldolase class-I
MKTWKGSSANISIAQKAFYQRAMYNGEARNGRYSGSTEKDAA